MRKLKLIHGKNNGKECESTDGRAHIYQDGDSLSLQFPNGEIQSRMLTSDPNHLVLSYTRTMMAFPFFRPEPGHIAIIGLGGGSIVKWCYHHLPAAEITVIEIDPHVISMRERFHIPADDNRLRVMDGDGADYVARTKDSPEVLVVDGFDVNGQSPQLCSQQFYQDCYRALAPDGLIVVNLCGPDDQQSMDHIRNIFNRRMVIVSPEDGENKIVFAFKGKRSRGETLTAEELAKGLLVNYVLIPVQVQSCS
jgi:spermidine synthase